MRNFWLIRAFRPGKRVRYIGPDKQLDGKVGKIKSIQGTWVDVEFEIIAYKIVQCREFTVEKDNLELV